MAGNRLQKLKKMYRWGTCVILKFPVLSAHCHNVTYVSSDDTVQANRQQTEWVGAFFDKSGPYVPGKQGSATFA